MRKIVLSIAGSDSSGGAGIQADIKAITHFGGWPVTSVTAVTAQDEDVVYAVEYVSVNLVKKQIELAIKTVDSIKIGMLGSSAVISTVIELLPNNVPIIVDPVMVSTSGYRLLSEDAVELMKTSLLPRAFVVTPNIPEAELLSGSRIMSREDMVVAGRNILPYGVKAVLLKGGHLIKNKKVFDVLITKDKEYFFTHDAIEAKNTHGTGCKLSAALACNLAQGKSLKQSVVNAMDYVRTSIVECY